MIPLPLRAVRGTIGLGIEHHLRQYIPRTRLGAALARAGECPGTPAWDDLEDLVEDLSTPASERKAEDIAQDVSDWAEAKGPAKHLSDAKLAELVGEDVYEAITKVGEKALIDETSEALHQVPGEGKSIADMILDDLAAATGDDCLTYPEMVTLCKARLATLRAVSDMLDELTEDTYDMDDEKEIERLRTELGQWRSHGNTWVTIGKKAEAERDAAIRERDAVAKVLHSLAFGGDAKAIEMETAALAKEVIGRIGK
jgi:hypothetical protein